MSKQKEKTNTNNGTPEENVFNLDPGKGDIVNDQIPEPVENDKELTRLKLIRKDIIDTINAEEKKEIDEQKSLISSLKEKLNVMNVNSELEIQNEEDIPDVETELAEAEETLKFLQEDLITKKNALVKCESMISDRLKEVNSNRAAKMETLIEKLRKKSSGKIQEAFGMLNEIADLELQRMKNIVASGQQTAFPVLDSFLADKYPLLISLCEVVRDGLDKEKIESLLYKLSREISGPVRGY